MLNCLESLCEAFTACTRFHRYCETKLKVNYSVTDSFIIFHRMAIEIVKACSAFIEPVNWASQTGFDILYTVYYFISFSPKKGSVILNSRETLNWRPDDFPGLQYFCSRKALLVWQEACEVDMATCVCQRQSPCLRLLWKLQPHPAARVHYHKVVLLLNVSVPCLWNCILLDRTTLLKREGLRDVEFKTNSTYKVKRKKRKGRFIVGLSYLLRDLCMAIVSTPY